MARPTYRPKTNEIESTVKPWSAGGGYISTAGLGAWIGKRVRITLIDDDDDNKEIKGEEGQK